MILKKNLALFFMICFMFIISAPTIIISIDNSFDTTVFFDMSEEEEKDGVKLLFEITPLDSTSLLSDSIILNPDEYKIKRYTNPHLNLVFPPPDLSLS